MESIVRALFDPSGLTPHGFCLLWDPGLIWLQAGSDAVVGLSYYSIPLALVYFVQRRRDVAFGWIFWLFAAFILACGTTHFMSILTLWRPYYWLDGAVKLVTAVLSLATALILWPLIPKALALPSPAELRQVNADLAQKIRDREVAEAALRASEARLREVQKMETLGHLTGGIAHDFNNLLTVMMGTLESIGRQVGRLPRTREAEAIEKSGDIALRAVDRAATLTERLLAFSRRQSLDPKPLDVNKLVAETSDLLHRTLGETIELETAFAPGLWGTRADQNQLENALLNLAVNARDAMPSGGKLTIATENVTLDEISVARLAENLAAGDYIVIAVTDTGVGMDRATLERAFEPFFTTKEVGKGTGLGLSQVYGFIRQSAGDVRIYSELGRGTTVRIYLPRFDSVDDGDVTEEPDDHPVGGGLGQLILLVEDDEQLRAYSTGALLELGYQVTAAADGPAALATLADRPDIALLFTDIVLPGPMNGRQLADEAVRRRPDLKVLFTTGYSRDAIVHNGELDPGVQVLAKPFTYPALAAKLRQVFGDQSDA